MEKILEKSGKSRGILSVRKSGNPVTCHYSSSNYLRTLTFKFRRHLFHYLFKPN